MKFLVISGMDHLADREHIKAKCPAQSSFFKSIILSQKPNSSIDIYSTYLKEFSNSNLYLCVVEYKKNIGFFLKEEDILDLAELFISQISRKSRDLDDSYRMDLLASQFMLWLSLTYKDEMIKCIPHPVTKKC